MLFSALVMRYVSEKSTLNKCGKQVFSVLVSAYFRGPVNLKYTIYPSTSTLNTSQYCMMFGSLTFCFILFAHTMDQPISRPWKWQTIASHYNQND